MIRPTGLPTIYSSEGLGVEMYDVLVSDRDAGLNDLEFLLGQAAGAGDPVLDLACGTGRIVWPMAVAGHSITGLDVSEPMLRRAEAKAAAHPEEVGRRVRLVRGDMRDFELGERFGLIFCTFRSFMALLTLADQRSALNAARRHLKPSGRLVLDLFDPQLDRLLPRGPYSPRWLGAHRHPVTGNTVAWESIDHLNDPVDQILQEIWRWTEVDSAGRIVRQEMEEITLRWTYRYEIRYLLELCGMRVVEELSDFQRAAPDYGKELIVVAETA